MEYLPQYCTRYGKVRIRGDGDQIRSAVSGNALSSSSKRDASFVRVSTTHIFIALLQLK